jgi:fumarate reductase subunit D
MRDSTRQLLTRVVIVLMILTALWGAWVTAENGFRRGRIGRLPAAAEPENK